MDDIKMNHIAVWVSVIVILGLGFLWYGPLFGESWMEMVGLSIAEAEANPPGAGTWITYLIATVVPLYVLAALFSKLDVNTAMTGAVYALLISFAFQFLNGMSGNMFAQDPYALSWIDGGYNMVAMTIGGLIIGGWTQKESQEESEPAAEPETSAHGSNPENNF